MLCVYYAHVAAVYCPPADSTMSAYSKDESEEGYADAYA